MSDELELNCSPAIAYEAVRLSSAGDHSRPRVALHSHYLSEFVLVRKGRARIIRNSAEYHLAPGEAIYFSPLVKHSLEPEGGGELIFDMVKFSSTRLREIPAWLPEMRALSLDAAALRLPVHFSAQEVSDRLLDQLVDHILLESREKQFAYDLKIRAMVYLLMAAIARFWLMHMQDHHGEKSIRRDSIISIPSYIEEHLSEPLRVEDLAAMCGLSYPWFAKKFHAFFGVSCKQFIEQMRLDTAELYLVHTDLDLNEISRQTGYTDCSHMVKDFRRLRGTTPGQFRTSMHERGKPPFEHKSAASSPNSPQRVDTQGKNG